jgi:hypothetical protein
MMFRPHDDPITAYEDEEPEWNDRELRRNGDTEMTASDWRHPEKKDEKESECITQTHRTAEGEEGDEKGAA